MPLAQVLNGEAPLKAATLEPVLERMTDRLFQIIDMGWSPNEATAEPVMWQRREYNKIADFIVNHTMDIGRDWQKTFHPPIAGYHGWDANFILPFGWRYAW